jgi:hypothetical protein
MHSIHAVLLSCILSLCVKARNARIKIDLERTIGEVDKISTEIL